VACLEFTLSCAQIGELDEASDIELGFRDDFIDEHSHDQSALQHPRVLGCR
jgi:hypothetical protein